MDLLQTWNRLVSNRPHRDEIRVIDHNRLPTDEPALHRHQIINISLLCTYIHRQSHHARTSSTTEVYRIFGDAALPTIATTKSLLTNDGANSYKSGAAELWCKF